ncbi:MAG: hypothetical protein LUP94_00380, partial [Candidatus Methanomethylicus sp.]|nr:hypothetical protein [Candidatus Methanomethylicus sp.]
GSPEYDYLNLTFTFYVQPAMLDYMSGTVQFWNYSEDKYIQTGNGCASFTKAEGIDAGSNYLRYTFIFPKQLGMILESNSSWNIMVNITSSKPNPSFNNKFDYFALDEARTYANGIQTLIYFNVSDVVTDPSDVTSLIFSTTGYFPSSVDYWVDVYNFDKATWQNWYKVSGDSSKQTSTFQIQDDCWQYISTNKLLILRYFPEDDLPLGTTVRIDQSRLLLRMAN